MSIISISKIIGKPVIIFIILVILSYLPFMVNSEVGFVALVVLFFYCVNKLIRIAFINGFKEIGLYRHKNWAALLSIGFSIGVIFNIFIYLILTNYNLISLEKVSVEKIVLIFVFAVFTTGFTAFAEELIFRGYLIGVLRKYFSWKWIILIIGVLFTLYHIPQLGLPFPYWIRFFVMAIVFTIPFIYTKSLWLSVGLHFGGNIAFYILLTEHGLLVSKKTEEVVMALGWVSAIMSFLMLGFMYMLLNFRGRQLANKSL